MRLGHWNSESTESWNSMVQDVSNAIPMKGETDKENIFSIEKNVHRS